MPPTVCETLIKARGEALTGLLRNEKMELHPGPVMEPADKQLGVRGRVYLLIYQLICLGFLLTSIL